MKQKSIVPKVWKSIASGMAFGWLLRPNKTLFDNVNIMYHISISPRRFLFASGKTLIIAFYHLVVDKMYDDIYKSHSVQFL